MSPSSSCPGTLPKTKSSKIPAIPRSSLKVPRLITARQTKRHNQWPRKTLRAPRRARLTMQTPPPVLTTSRSLNPPRTTRRSGTVEREVLFLALFVFFDQAVDEFIGKLVVGQNHIEHLLPRLVGKSLPISAKKPRARCFILLVKAAPFSHPVWLSSKTPMEKFLYWIWIPR